MPRESQVDRRKLTRRIIDVLRATYPDAHCELNHSSPLQLLIATILSAQSTDKMVNQVTANLFPRYPTAQDFAQADLKDLEDGIRQLGFFRNKAKSIRACCAKLVDRHNGEVPRTMEELQALDGVGRKTANVVLGNAFHANVGIVVDTHVSRLSRRLDLTRRTTPEKIEQDLMKLVDQTDWTLFSHWLIWHGRRRCSSRKPRCDECEVAPSCPRREVSVR